MASHFVDSNAPSFLAGYTPRPEELPHGVIIPPPRVREIVDNEKAKFAPEFAADDTWRTMTESLTLQYYFDSLGHEVLYRRTPEGPDVLAVGFDEVREYVKGMPVEDQLKLKTWAP